MSKGFGYQYTGTKGHIIAITESLPPNPSMLVKNGWEDITNPQQAQSSNSREFREANTGLKVRFDKGIEGKPGFSGMDHYHVYNPNATGNGNLYLDSTGKPVRKGHRRSHIIPKGE